MRRFKSLPRYGFAICSLWLWGCLLLCGCSPIAEPTDAGNGDIDNVELRCFSPGNGRPTISELNYNGQAPLQPRTLQFRLAWSDPEKDLGPGQALFWIDGKAQPPIALPRDEIDGKSRGYFSLVLVLSPDFSPKPSTTLTLELLLVDAKGNRSNRTLLSLETHR